MNESMYFDKNAFITRVKVQERPKVDLQHIEKVIYPVNYENMPEHYDKNIFKDRYGNVQPQPQKPNFDITKLLPLLLGKGDLSSLLPSLLNNMGMGNDLMQLIKNFAPIKKVEAKVVDDFEKDSISKYPKIE